MHLPVTLTLRRSRQLAFLLAAAHAVAAAAVLPIVVPAWAKAFILLSLLASLAASLYRYGRRSTAAALTLRGDGGLDVALIDGSVVPASVHHWTTVLPWLVVLWWRDAAGRRALPLLSDALDGEDGRRLRLWLRWRAVPAGGA